MITYSCTQARIAALICEPYKNTWNKCKIIQLHGWGCRDGMHHAKNHGNKEIPLAILSREPACPSKLSSLTNNQPHVRQHIHHPVWVDTSTHA